MAPSVQESAAARDLYEVLGVHPAADLATIKKRYYKLSLKFHPDRNPDCQESKQEFVAIHQAYHVLGSGELRKQYDARRHNAAFLNKHEPPSTGQWGEDVQRRYEQQFYSRHHATNAQTFTYKRPNSRVFFFVCVIGLCGIFFQLQRMSWASNLVRESYDLKDSIATEHLIASKKTAHINGFKRQLDLLVSSHQRQQEKAAEKER